MPMAAYQYIYVMKGLSKVYPGGRKVPDIICCPFRPGTTGAVLALNAPGQPPRPRTGAGLDPGAGGGSGGAAGASFPFPPQEPALPPAPPPLLLRTPLDSSPD